MRRALRGLGTALLIAGLALLIDALLTVVWQEPFSAAYAHFVQGGLDDDLQTLDSEGPGQGELEALSALQEREQKVAYLARSLRARVGPGEPLMKIWIPSLGVTRAVVDGTDTASLRKGPGLIESTDMPGLGGTTAVAGHRTTYSAPFRNINRLRKGNRVVLETAYGRFVYRVTGHRIVKPTDTWVLDRIGRERLVLSACHPLYSAEQRIIVFADLQDYTPPKTGPWARALRGGSGELSAAPSP